VPYKQETVAKLLEQPFIFLAMNPATLADIEADIRLLGGITQRTAAAGRLVKKMRHAFLANREKSTTVQVASPRLLRSVAESADQFPSLGGGIGEHLRW